MKKGTILFICMIFVTKFVFSQSHLLKPSTTGDFKTAFFNISFAYTPLYVNNRPVSPKFYVNNLGFFCRQELKVQAITRVPIKFRLGAMEYNNWMEGKINAGVNPNYK